MALACGLVEVLDRDSRAIGMLVLVVWLVSVFVFALVGCLSCSWHDSSCLYFGWGARSCWYTYFDWNARGVVGVFVLVVWLCS